MKQKINEEVSVIMYYSSKVKHIQPYLLHWQSNDYPLGKVSYYHSYMEGRDRQHIFELTDKAQSMWFRLRLDSKNLHWTLEAVHDGNAY
jgi:hypothetical protein